MGGQADTCYIITKRVKHLKPFTMSLIRSMSSLARHARFLTKSSPATFPTAAQPVLCRLLSITTARFSEVIKYTSDHEWISINGDIGTVGLTQHAQDSLGDIVYVELPEEDAEFEKGECVGVVESVKAVGEIYSPVSGTITEANQNVVGEPGLINSNYADKGWLFRVKVADASELDAHMSEEDYHSYLKTL